MSTKQIIAERSAQQIVAEDFMIARARIVELAAVLDRIDRAAGDVNDSKNMLLLVQGLHILCDVEAEKAKRVQLLMSRQYDPQWQTQMSIEKKGA